MMGFVLTGTEPPSEIVPLLMRNPAKAADGEPDANWDAASQTLPAFNVMTDALPTRAWH
jgi:hypothetical protein